MTKTITLEDIRHGNWSVNLDLENVEVPFEVIDATGHVWQRGIAIFWRNIPELTDPDGTPLPTPDEWFQVPLSRLQAVNDLNNDIHTALMNRFL